MIDSKETGLQFFEFSDTLQLKDSFPRKKQYEILGKLRFIKRNKDDTDLCLVMDDQGEFWSFYSQHLQKVEA